MAEMAIPSVLSRAVATAESLHGRQRRKGTEIPYISHLIAVAGLALEGGGSEETAVAALLHDAVEDAGGPETLAAIRAQFGERSPRSWRNAPTPTRTRSRPGVNARPSICAIRATTTCPTVRCSSRSPTSSSSRCQPIRHPHPIPGANFRESPLAFVWRTTRRGYRFEVYDAIADEAPRLYETELHVTEHDAWQDVCLWAANRGSEPIALQQALPG